MASETKKQPRAKPLAVGFRAFCANPSEKAALSPFDFSGLEAAGAHVHLTPVGSIGDAYRLYVCMPHLVGTPVGVAHLLPEMDSFAANLAFCHCYHLLTQTACAWCRAGLEFPCEKSQLHYSITMEDKNQLKFYFFLQNIFIFSRNHSIMVRMIFGSYTLRVHQCISISRGGFL